jgi:multiple sugar transport system ATP-binding protein
MTAIRLEGLQKSFDKGAPILSELTLSVAKDERVAVVGPSGAGKTTLLRLIAGFEKPDAGEIFIGDRDVTNLPPEQRDIGFVFQNHALYPHLTVEENLAFPLRLRNVPRAEIAKRVNEMATLLQLNSFLARRPQELSGGEAQRVALGRALIREPAALLMDEPLSSLPPDLRLQLRHELIKLHTKQPRPLFYVTHDHEEALAIGQRVAVLHHGDLQQIGSPREIYERPANRFVAGFVGRPTMNFVSGEWLKRQNKVNVAGAETIGIRPEHLELCDAADAWVSAVVDDIQYGGFHADVFAKSEAGNLIVRIFGAHALKVGETLPLRARPEFVHAFDAGGRRVGI